MSGHVNEVIENMMRANNPQPEVISSINANVSRLDEKFSLANDHLDRLEQRLSVVLYETSDPGTADRSGYGGPSSLGSELGRLCSRLDLVIERISGLVERIDL